MRNRSNRQTIMLAAIAVIFLCGASASVFAQKKGAITEREVKDYFVYWWTHDCEAGDQCTVTFDSTVRLAPAVRHTFQIPNATYLTYPVKVDFTTHKNGGTFHLQHMTRAVYYFHRNSFDEWEMGKEGEEIKQEKDTHQQGGTAKTGAPQAKTQPANTATPAGDNRDENGYPKPDLSELEKYYEIVRYEYKPNEGVNGYLYIYLKPKTDDRPRSPYCVQFRDKDGMLIGYGNPNGNEISMSTSTPVGELEKVWTSMPREKEMEKVVSAKVIRVKQ